MREYIKTPISKAFRTALVRKHDSTLAWLAQIERETSPENMVRQLNSTWNGGMNLRQCMDITETARNVTQSALDRAKEFIDLIDATVGETDKPTWKPDVQGAFPVVPEFLAGEPQNMRTWRDERSERAPVTLVIEMVVSSNTTDQQMFNRAMGLCALAMKMSETRPVELHALFSMREGNCVQANFDLVKLDIPVSPTQILALSDKSACRGIALNSVYDRRGSRSGFMSWAYNGYGDPSDYYREMLELESSAVIVHGLHTLMDMNRTDTVAWIESRLKEQREFD